MMEVFDFIINVMFFSLLMLIVLASGLLIKQLVMKKRRPIKWE